MARIRRLQCAALGGLIALVVGCYDTNNPPPWDPTDDPLPPTAGTCEDACKNLRSLHCASGDPTLGRDGKPGTGDEHTCEEVCNNAERTGQSVNPGCLEHAQSCGEADGC